MRETICKGLIFESLTPKEFLAFCDKDYAESKISGLEEFKEKFAQYLESYEQHKNEQNEPAIVSNVLAPFLQELGFRTHDKYKQQSNSEIDLALLKDSQVEILIEAKTQKNKTEMFSAENPNCKALRECILYYLRERNGDNQTLIPNASLRFVVITDFIHFYIFSAQEFERHFYKNKEILKLYKTLNEKGTIIKTQDDFYTELQKILVKQLNGGGAEENLVENSTLRYTTFDLRNDKHLYFAHKILHRDFLHNEFKRDPNALNPRFYKELLHILGLKEFDKGSKITIEPDNTQSISFAKHIASKLEYHNKPSDFEVVMSHILIWLNRILFLKLIEANLLTFNDFDKALNFLSSAKITSFKHLSHLFFGVLAKDYEDSNKDEKDKRGSDKGFNFLPYLNSSLFIRDNALEILDIGALDDDLEIQIFESTQTAHKKDKTYKFLTYLFDFLNAFDFGKEQKDSTQKHKDLIRSSVLGAVFEKLNGYKEGSFYTPNFITSYMCKESLSKIVIEKFNTAFGWDAKDLESLRKQINRNFDKEMEFKKILESIRICDPSVGSGHFLVSALNEMIVIYHKLGLLGFGYKSLEVQDDEILLITKEGERFAYKRLEDENHQIQIALFNLKKSIIENNLFGVDINPNSCNIARLRLWIELLKNAYYLNFAKDKDSKIHKLQTLPNIDINIKCGNSLISYMGIEENLLLQTTEQIKKYQKLETDYFNGFYRDKDAIIKEIEKVKRNLLNQHFATKFKDSLEYLKTECEKYSNSYGDYAKESLGQHYEFIKNHISISGLFAPSLDEQMQEKAKQELEKLKSEHDKIFNLSKNFEWRIEFPKLLNIGLTKEQITHNNQQKQKGNFKDLYKDEGGKFLGFDLVIGNPPYMQVPKNIFNAKLYPFSEGKDKGKQNLYKVFIELGYNLGHTNSIISLITQSSIMCDLSAQYTRELLLKNTQMHYFVEFKDNEKIFTNVSQAVCMLEFQKIKPDKLHGFQIAINNTESQMDKIQFESITQQQILDFFPLYEIPLIKKGEMAIVAKVKTDKILLKDLLDSSLQGNINTIHLNRIRSIKHTGIYLVKGANIHRYYLDNDFMNCIKSNETLAYCKRNAQSYIIAMQGIHAATSKNRIHCTFLESKNTKNFVFLHSTKILFVECKETTKLLVALLNSFLLNWLFRITSTNNNVNLYELESLPIPKITKQNQKIVDRIIVLVDEILKLKAKDSTLDTSKLESQIDCLVYKLYNITNNEIKIVESKH